jgi:two-component system sensor histidine kinase KdpD
MGSVGRGALRIYLGAAPGVGKTYAMLGEGRRRAGRGTDVVVGFVEDHGRRHTAAMVDGLEVAPRRQVRYGDATVTEMDVDAVLARRPRVALVDELAHTNVPGSRHAKRWQDVEELLDAGIDVVTTLNIQHLESLNDVVAAITGVPQRETLPDAIARRAEQIELVDMTPEALRRRMAHGNVYAAETVDAALADYFRVGNLAALRELALLWLADRVDEGLERYRSAHRITATWPTRERVVVALTGGPEGEPLVRHAARLASRGAGGELMAVYVSRSDGLTGASPELVVRLRALVESLGGSFATVVGDDVAEAVLDYARAVNASAIVIGASRRGRLATFLVRGIGEKIIAGSGEIAVQVVAHEHAAGGLRRRRQPGLRRSRQALGWVLAVLGPPALTMLLTATRNAHTRPVELLLFLALTVGVALVGGRWPALACAVWAGMLANYYFTPPVHTWTIEQPEDVVALLVSAGVGVAVASVVDAAARRSAEAARARAEADILADLAGSVLRGEAGLDALLQRAVEAFGMESAALLERDGDHGAWRCTAVRGPGDPCTSPEEADASVPAGRGRALALRGRVLPAADQKVLAVFAAQAGELVERERLRRSAAAAGHLAEGNRVRTALLAAVSHDLRTPLAGIKAASSGLRHGAVHLSEEDRAELVATIEEYADRLDRLVANLLDLSRLQTDAVRPLTRPVTLDGVVASALVGIGEHPGRTVGVDVPEDLPEVLADAGLLERVVANVVENGLRYGGDVTVVGSALRDRVELRVVDRGRGVPESAKASMFAPFQRLGDAPAGTGVGLGLAVARGLTEAMDGALTAEDTPGGGLTLVLSLPAALPCAQARTGAEQVRA